MQLRPTEILDWADPKDFNLDYYSNGSPIGYFIETDLNFPDELHDLHNDYPIVGQKIAVRKEMLSDDQLQIMEDNNFFLGKNKKFILNLGNKVKYKLQYQNLKLYSDLGLQLKKCSRPFLKPYI